MDINELKIRAYDLHVAKLQMERQAQVLGQQIAQIEQEIASKSQEEVATSNGSLKEKSKKNGNSKKVDKVKA